MLLPIRSAAEPVRRRNRFGGEEHLVDPLVLLRGQMLLPIRFGGFPIILPKIQSYIVVTMSTSVTKSTQAVMFRLQARFVTRFL